MSLYHRTASFGRNVPVDDGEEPPAAPMVFTVAGPQYRDSETEMYDQESELEDGEIVDDSKEAESSAAKTVPQAAESETITSSSDDTISLLKRRNKVNWKLNNEQLDAVKLAVYSDVRVALVFGFPGTGKTRTMATIAFEHVLLGSKVLFVCPTVEEVDVALLAYELASSSYHHHTTVTERHRNETLRFAGNHTTGSSAAKESSFRQTFHAQLEKVIGRWQVAWSHPMQEEADASMTALQRAKTQEVRSSSNEAERIRKLRERLTGYCHKEEVDTVFTTFTTALHSTLHPHFKPVVILIDGKGHTSATDMCVVLEPLKDKVKYLIMSGYYNLLGRPAEARMIHETLAELEGSPP